MSERDPGDELEAARRTIAQQAARIQSLESASQSNTAVDALQAALHLAEVAGTTIGEAPYRALLEGIVTAARRLFHAGASSIALLDRATNELVFEAATGAGSDDVLGMRFPAQQGIAGWVAMTGEAIAVADVRQDPRFARSFAQSTGYVPTSIMAAPLFVGDEVEGVIEVLDRAGEDPFGLDDLELLGLFARPAAVAVEQARMVSGVGRLVLQELAARARQDDDAGLARTVDRALSRGSDAEEDTLELARLVHQLARRNERSRRLAYDILTGVLRYTER